MKLSKILKCLSGICIVILTFTFWMEMANPDLVEVSFSFFKKGIVVNYWQFLVLVFIVYTLASLVTIKSYHIVFPEVENTENESGKEQRNEKDEEKLGKTTRFIRVVAFKYFLPYLLILFTTINGESIFFGLEVSGRLVLLFVSISLLLDWLIFYFRYSKRDVITVEIGSLVVKIPVRTLYINLSVWILFIILAIIIWRSTKRYTEGSKPYSSFCEKVSYISVPIIYWYP